MSNTRLQGTTDPEGSQPGAERLGFIQSHISPRAPENSASLSVFSDLAKFHIPAAARIGGGTRGAIAGFSPQSRKRFMESFARARNIQGGSFATLTYPAIFPTDPEQYHRDLDTLLKRLARWEPNARGWWRLEFQQRGAPHFHVLIFGARRNTKQLRRWLKVAWFQVVGSDNVYHFQAGTQCDIIHNRRHAGRYISKYAAKTNQENVEARSDTEKSLTGRTWGMFGTIDQAPVLSVALAPWQVCEIKRALVRWLHSRSSRYERRLARSPASQGFAVFGAGDQSHETWTNLEQSVIYRIVQPFLSG